MIRPLVKTAALLALLFASLIGTIRAQPYDDGGLQKLLAPQPGCWLPCWNAIRLHDTTVTEASTILASYAPAGELGYHLGQNPGQIYWQWSTLQPIQRRIAQLAYVWLDEDRVTQIYLPGFRAYVDVWMLLGKPREVQIYRDMLHDSNRLIYLSVYDGDIYVESQITCSARAVDLWHSLTAVIIGRIPRYVGAWMTPYAPSDLRGWLPDELC
ncbi:MAG: hypothetical protein K8L99_12690 [Anaerolineae bacterium]|nr:hypothetical protein [Anaerolineae bacterium]